MRFMGELLGVPIYVDAGIVTTQQREVRVPGGYKNRWMIRAIVTVVVPDPLPRPFGYGYAMHPDTFARLARHIRAHHGSIPFLMPPLRR